MAIPLKIGVGDLLAELAAHTHVILDLLQPAGAVKSLLQQRLAQTRDDLRILVVANLHRLPSLAAIKHGLDLFLAAQTDRAGERVAVDVHVKRLREKIKDHAGWGITTVWGIGYKFEVKD